jgi:hypothetical protein
MITKPRLKKKRYLIGIFYQVLNAFKKYLLVMFRFNIKNDNNLNKKSSVQDLRSDSYKTAEEEPVIIVETKNAGTQNKQGQLSVNYNLYFLPSPQKKLPVLRDASNELLRMSMFSVEYHKYLQKEFLEFAHE